MKQEETNKTMSTFEPGEKVWIEYKQAEYVEETENGHKVKYTDRDEETTKTITYRPLKEDDWKPTGYFKNGNQFLKYGDEKTAWLRDSSLKFYYKMKNSGTFKDDDYMDRTRIAELETVSDDTFWSEEKMGDELQKIYEAAKPIREQIKELERKLHEIEKPKSDVYAHCFHDWYKGEEVEGSRDSFGTSISQECECQICGKETTQYFSRIN